MYVCTYNDLYVHAMENSSHETKLLSCAMQFFLFSYYYFSECFPTRAPTPALNENSHFLPA